MSQIYDAILHQFFRQSDITLERAEAALTLSTDNAFAQRVAEATILQGWALSGQKTSENAIVQINRGLADFRATGTELYRPWYLSMLADAYRQNGQITKGVEVLAEAITLNATQGERWCDAELYRFQGELFLQKSLSDTQKAEACFCQSLDIARRQEAKSWELRAATSLAKLWQRQGKCQEAYALLAPVYGWFTEGFDTADLKDAKSLLDELG